MMGNDGWLEDETASSSLGMARWHIACWRDVSGGEVVFWSLRIMDRGNPSGGSNLAGLENCGGWETLVL
jgi:hypothetical protein